MRSLDYLDAAQREAVKCTDNNILVVAAPGSGKTTTIINRVNYFESLGVSRDNIIIITFTKAAAVSMRNRYKSMFKRNTSPFFGTFHSLFYRILKRLNYKFEIIPGDKAKYLIKNKLAKIYDDVADEKIRDIINAISSFKSSGCDLEEFTVEGCNSKVFKECYEAYENYKVENNYYDFDDLEIQMYNVFLKDKSLLKSYGALFKYVLIDEFQDCDLLQINILKLLSSVGTKIFAVGDEDQCIYGFRGARPDCMVNFQKEFNKGRKVFLHINYRCPKNIVDYSCKLISNNNMRNEKKINSFKGKNGIVKCNVFEDERTQARFISEFISGKVSKEGTEYKDYTILYRTNEECRILIDIFTREKLPFNIIDRRYNFYDNFICRDILNYLRLSAHICDKELFVKVINKPFRYVGKNILMKLGNYPYKENCFNIIENMEELQVFQIKNIKKLNVSVCNLNKLSLLGAINSVLYDLDYYEYLKEYSIKFKVPMEELDETINAFIDSAKDFSNIVEFLTHIENVKSKIEKERSKKSQNQDGVLLSTIHGVKGMEFPNVLIVNCNEDIIPYSKSVDDEQNLEEERRIFYVAITRSSKNLYISYIKNRLGKPLKPSRFIGEIDIKTSIEEFFKLGDNVSHVTFGMGRVNYIDKKSINVLFPKGIERKFDLQIVINYGLLKKVW